MWTLWYFSKRSLRPRRIDTVSSSEGGSTCTGWNRRSSAASFSMYLRYSSSVVAPTQCSSPRASIGLSMLPASCEPSVLPAPTIVWISSMKRMMRPFAARISFKTALSRSSNWPRYCAPAMSAVMSSEKTVRSFSPSGTSPRTMRCASPSTMAVLPTPGSPMRTGLFFVLRERMRMTSRISVSRPMTGSSLPARASSTRSVPYFFSASYCPSGLSVVTRWLPRTARSASRKFFFSTPASFSIFAQGVFPSSSMPRTRCSTETYSSFIVRAASSACISTFARSFEMYTLSISTFPVIRGLSLIACSRRAVSGPVPAPIFANRFGTSPCESFTRAKSRCSTSICCWPWCRATFCAASIASRTFVVYLSAFMFSSPSPFHKQEPCQRSETKSRSSKRPVSEPKWHTVRAWRTLRCTRAAPARDVNLGPPPPLCLLQTLSPPRAGAARVHVPDVEVL